MGIQSRASLKLPPTGMTFVHLKTLFEAVFLHNRASTKNAFFLFMDFQRSKALIST